MYKVELKKNFNGERRNRAGLSFLKGEVYELKLDKEQLAALEADGEFIVSEVKKAGASNDASDTSQSAGRRRRARQDNGEPIVAGKEEVTQVSDPSGTVDTSTDGSADARQMVDKQDDKQA